MSISPHAIYYRNDKKLLEDRLIDTMIYDGLVDAFNNYHSGDNAEKIAANIKIQRKE